MNNGACGACELNPVLRYIEGNEKAGDPVLSLYIKLSKPYPHGPVIEIESNFRQNVRPLRDPKTHTSAVTWESKTSDRGPISDRCRAPAGEQSNRRIHQGFPGCQSKADISSLMIGIAVALAAALPLESLVSRIATTECKLPMSRARRRKR